jgi:hypothetical protein
VYVGDDGIASLTRLYAIDMAELTQFEYRESILQQDCLQCSFENKSELSPIEYTYVKAYADEHAIRFRGKQAYPVFRKYSPNHLPWRIKDKSDKQILLEAIEATLEMARLIDSGELDADAWEFVPLLNKCENGYELSFTELPEAKPVEYPEPRVTNDITLAKLKRVKHRGTVECNIIRLTEPIQHEADTAPVFPVMLVVADPNAGEIMPMPPISEYEVRAEEYLNMLVDTLLEQNKCPKSVNVCNERTYLFMKNLCAGADIVLNMVNELPSVASFESDFMDYLSGDNLDDGIVAMLMDMDAEQIAQLPKDMIGQLVDMAANELLPVELEAKLEDAFQLAMDDGKLINLELVRNMNNDSFDDDFE